MAHVLNRRTHRTDVVRSIRRVFPAPLIAIILLAFALRAYHLDFKGLWGDEIWTAELSVQPARSIFSQSLDLMLANVIAGPFHFLVAHVALDVLGLDHTEIALRLPSVVASVLVVPAVYALARRVWGRLAGLIAALLLAVSPFQVWYAQEARYYAWTTLLSTLSCLLLVCALARPRARLAWLGFVGVTALNLYNHTMPAFIVLGAQACCAGLCAFEA